MARKAHCSPDHVHCSCVVGLEADVQDLKRRLAELSREDPLLRMKGKVKRTGIHERDWLDDLPSQDRKHMLRKLGWKE
jgi:hypothetical protein